MFRTYIRRSIYHIFDVSDANILTEEVYRPPPGDSTNAAGFDAPPNMQPGPEVLSSLWSLSFDVG